MVELYFIGSVKGISSHDSSTRRITAKRVDEFRGQQLKISKFPGEMPANKLRGHVLLIGTLWLFNIAMEHGPFIDGLPIKNGDFPWLC